MCSEAICVRQPPTYISRLGPEFVGSGRLQCASILDLMLHDCIAKIRKVIGKIRLDALLGRAVGDGNLRCVFD